MQGTPSNRTSWLRPTAAGGLFVAAVLAVGLLAPPATIRGDDEAELPSNPYVLLPDASLEQLDGFVQGAERRPATIRKRKPFQMALIDSAERVLEHADASDEQKIAATDALLNVLSTMAFEGDADAKGRLVTLANKLADDPREELAREAERVQLAHAVDEANLDDGPTASELLDRALAYFREQETLTERHRDVVSAAIRVMNKVPNEIAAGEAYVELGEKFSESRDQEISRAGRQVAKYGKEYLLSRKPVEIEGTLLGGGDLDWSAYEGKVVLVEFWATWCGPCVAELPNIQAQYDKFHERGFEVVAISLDVDREAVEAFIDEHKIPWTVLFEDDEDKAGPKHPMVQKFGIRAIPAGYLIGPDGKIVTRKVRGASLGKALDELLPEKPAS